MSSVKIKNVIALAKILMLKGAYTISNHAKLRQGERSFSLGDLKNVIQTGRHEKNKDEFNEAYSDRNYALKGKTLDNEQARVCIAFIEENHFIVVTVIRLEK